jgi:hypothetical protein
MMTALAGLIWAASRGCAVVWLAVVGYRLRRHPGIAAVCFWFAADCLIEMIWGLSVAAHGETAQLLHHALLPILGAITGSLAFFALDSFLRKRTDKP